MTAWWIVLLCRIARIGRYQEVNYVQSVRNWYGTKPIGGETRPGHHVTPLALPIVQALKATPDRKLRRA